MTGGRRTKIGNLSLNPDISKLIFKGLANEPRHVGDGEEKWKGKITPGHVSPSRTKSHGHND
jgi:hypothetical protein